MKLTCRHYVVLRIIMLGIVPLPQRLHETGSVLFHNLTLSLTCVIIFTILFFNK